MHAGASGEEVQACCDRGPALLTRETGAGPASKGLRGETCAACIPLEKLLTLCTHCMHTDHQEL